jgi:hypothetical protein
MPLVAPFPPSATLLATAPVEGLARAIQLSLAPVFLLAGVSGLLGVFTKSLRKNRQKRRVPPSRDLITRCSGWIR